MALLTVLIRGSVILYPKPCCGKCGKTISIAIISIAKLPSVSYLQQGVVVYPPDKRYPRLKCVRVGMPSPVQSFYNVSPRKLSSIVDRESDIVDPQNSPQSKGSSKAELKI